ncbi:MAG: cell division protein FtsL [candidate division Zixibacteria bacterium]|nr:cell division protein FtsL [candidate division Zixibacteria bacterium]
MKKPVRKFKETIEIQASIFNRIRSHRYFPVVILVSLFLSASLVHIWQRVRVLELVRNVSELERENAELVDAATKLNADIAALSTANRIQKYASDTLGLRQISADRLFALVRKEQSVSLPDDLELMFRAVERVTKYVPVLEESRTVAGELRPTRLDSMLKGRRNR